MGTLLSILVPSCRGPRQHGQFSASKVERGQIKAKSKIKRRRGTLKPWEKSNRCRRKIRSRPRISIASMLLIKQPQGQTADLKGAIKSVGHKIWSAVASGARHRFGWA